MYVWMYECNYFYFIKENASAYTKYSCLVSFENKRWHDRTLVLAEYDPLAKIPEGVVSSGASYV